MVGYSLKNTITENGPVARGVCSLNENGYLAEICERTRIQRFGEAAKFSEDGGETWVGLPLNSTVSMNMWGFTPSIFEELERYFHRFLQRSNNLHKAEFFLPEVVNKLLKTKQARVKVIPTKERWVGVTYRDDKSVVEQYINGLICNGLYPDKLWEYLCDRNLISQTLSLISSL